MTDKIKAIGDGIIFVFEDSITIESDNGMKRSQFKENTDWGFEWTSYDDSLKTPRWGIIIHVGPKVKDITLKKGARILIEPLKWTEGFEVDRTKYWRTNEDFIIGIDDDK